MAAVTDFLRGEHKDISRVLFQLLPLIQQPCDNDTQKRIVINQLEEKLMQLDVLIGGAHHLVEELMMQKLAAKELDKASQQLVDNMLSDHELLDVFSELLLLRIEEYLSDSGKKAVLIRGVNQYVKHHIQHINREQVQLFKLCESKLSTDDWQALVDVYPLNERVQGPKLLAV